MKLDFNISFGTLDKAEQESYDPFLSADAKAFFQEQNVYAFGAFNNDTDELIGVAVFQAEDPAKLLSIAVSYPYRNMGIGDAMVVHMVEILSEAGAEGMECLLSEDGDELNEITGTGLFFWRCGFSPVESFSDFSFSLKSARDNFDLEAIMEKWPMEGFGPAPEADSDEGAALMGFLPVEPSKEILNYSPAFSTVYRKNGKIAGCLLVSEEEDSFLVNIVHMKARNLELVHAMTVRSLMAIAERYGDMAELRFIAGTEKADEVYSSIFPIESSETRLTRYTLPFCREKGPEPRNIDVPLSPEAPDPRSSGNEASDDGSISHFADDPVLTPVTDADLICRDCLYRLGGSDTLACHKYNSKPGRIINGGNCEKYYRERRA